MISFSPEIIATRQTLLLRIPDRGRVAEVGVWSGAFAAEILMYLDPRELHLIDPWEGMIACGDQHGKNILWKEGGDLYRSVCSRFEHHRVVRIHRGRSEDVLATFPDGYFDFIYIDGDHAEASVARDLKLALRKCSGYIGGHDYTVAMFPGVVAAVDRFCARHHFRIKYLTQDGCPSYLLERA
jgi:hypothetical protein